MSSLSLPVSGEKSTGVSVSDLQEGDCQGSEESWVGMQLEGPVSLGAIQVTQHLQLSAG